MTIHETMKRLGVPINNWCSDLYVPVNDVTTGILNLPEYTVHKKNATKFRCNIKHILCYDIPFAYDNYRRY